MNWPDLNYNNGVSKNRETGRRFKKVVRILKRLRNEMAEAGYSAASGASSYLIECLVFNVPTGDFCGSDLYADVRSVLAHIYNSTRPDVDCTQWLEVNEFTLLFGESGPGTKEQAFAFASSAWSFIGFED